MIPREIIPLNKNLWKPGDICKVLDVNPKTIRVTARQRLDLMAKLGH